MRNPRSARPTRLTPTSPSTVSTSTSRSSCPLFFDRSTWSDAGAPAEATVHLHATDVDGEWMIRIGDTEITAEHGHGKGDVAARGRAADLFLLVWGRGDLSDLETFGDASLLERFLASCRV